MHIALHVTSLTLDVMTSAHGMYYLDFGHSVVSTSHSVSAAGVQRDRMIPGSSTREVCSGFYTYMCKVRLSSWSVCVLVCQCVRHWLLEQIQWIKQSSEFSLHSLIIRSCQHFCVYFRITPHYVTTQLPTFLCVLLNYTCYIATQWMYLHTLYQTWSHQSLETLISDCVVLDILHKIEGFCVLYWKLWSDFPCKQPGLVWI